MYNWLKMKKSIVLTKEEIIHLAKLANLDLSPSEISKYESQLGETITYVENLKEIATEKTPPTANTTNANNVFFQDGSANKRQLMEQEALQNTKNKKNSYFVVKRIM